VRRFDGVAFRADHPDLYDQYTITGDAARRFLLK